MFRKGEHISNCSIYVFDRKFLFAVVGVNLFYID